MSTFNHCTTFGTDAGSANIVGREEEGTYSGLILRRDCQLWRIGELDVRVSLRAYKGLARFHRHARIGLWKIIELASIARKLLDPMLGTKCAALFIDVHRILAETIRTECYCM